MIIPTPLLLPPNVCTAVTVLRTNTHAAWCFLKSIHENRWPPEVIFTYETVTDS